MVRRIVRRKGVYGGEPIFEGTRIPVSAIVEYWQMYRSKERIISALPDLTVEDIDAALRYYQKHRQEIDGYIKQHEEAEEDLEDVLKVLKRAQP